MKTQLNVASILVLGSAMLVGTILLSAHVAANSATTKENQPNYGTGSVIGDSSEDVERYALWYVRQHLIVSGTPQVLLVRPITQGERPSLGLGCPQTKVTTEEPPETLVILKGDFDISGAVGGLATSPPWHFSYVAYIFSNRSGHHTTFIYSRNGESFRVALNDPTLPSDGPEGETISMPIVCPTQLPNPKIQHDGEIEPTVSAGEVPISGKTPIPTEILPDPIPTRLSK